MTHEAFCRRNPANKVFYQFIIGNAETGSIYRIITVLVQNQFGIEFMERLLAVDGKVADNCVCIGVFRDPSSWDKRSSAFEIVRYVDFVIDIVDQARMMTDDVHSITFGVIEFFKESLSSEDKRYISEKCWRIEKHMERVNPALKDDPVEAEEYDSVDDDVIEVKEDVFDVQNDSGSKEIVVHQSKPLDQLIGALCGLGFKRSTVKTWAASIGNRVTTTPLQVLVKEGLIALS